MTLAILLLFKKIRCSGGFYSSIVRPLSEAGYGMYLAHMLVLGAVSGLMRGWLGIGGQGCLGIWTTPVEILATALISFPAVALATVLIRNIPKVGKWIMG
jgi:peptidoglycan/LPS O-acetylase OafA/YrhL